MLGFLLKKWSNVICSDITVRKEQDTGARGRFARSAGSCMGMSHPLSLAFFSSHPGKKVLYIYGSVFFPSDIWTQSISAQSLIYQNVYQSKVIHLTVSKNCMLLNLVRSCSNKPPAAAADCIQCVCYHFMILLPFVLTRNSSSSPSPPCWLLHWDGAARCVREVWPYKNATYQAP